MEIYLDHAATTKMRDEVLEAMLPYLQHHFGNPSSLYEIGIRNRRMINEARREIKQRLNLPAGNIFFTSSGTESNNWSLKGLAFRNPDKKEIITTRIEHHSILNTCHFLERFGYIVHYLSVDEQGFISLTELEELINDDTLVVSIHYANNEIGTIQEVSAIAKICEEKGVYFHCDATQAVGHIPIETTGIDLLTFSAHKFYGPKGIGALYVKDGVFLDPLIHGGDQEKGQRAGTENVAAIVGLVTALKLAIEEQEEYLKLRHLTTLLFEGLQEHLGDGVRLNGPAIGPKRLANNLNVSFKGIDGNKLSFYLGKQGIYVSTGSACDFDRIEPSHVIQSIGVPEDYRNGTIRMTLGRNTTREMIERTVDFITQYVK